MKKILFTPSKLLFEPTPPAGGKAKSKIILGLFTILLSTVYYLLFTVFSSPTLAQPCSPINAHVEPMPAPTWGEITFIFTSNIGYINVNLDTHGGYGFSGPCRGPDPARCSDNPTGDGNLCWWQWKCPTGSSGEGTYTATFNGQISGPGTWCSKDTSYTIVTRAPRSCDINKDPVVSDVWQQNYEGRNFERFCWDGLGMAREGINIFSFDWREPHNPHCVGGGNYSVKFTGWLTAPEGTAWYRIMPEVNDGVRMMLDKNDDGDFNDPGELIINEWGNINCDTCTTSFCAHYQYLEAGRWYKFGIDYTQESNNDGYITLRYAKESAPNGEPPPCFWGPTFPKSAFKTCYPPAPTPSPTPTPTPIPLPRDCKDPLTDVPRTASPVEGPSIRLVFEGDEIWEEDQEILTKCPGPIGPDGRKIGKGDKVSLTWQASFKIEDLESAFAKYNSDYFEGNFQDLTFTHQQANLLNLTSSQWNSYNGPAQKLSPAILFDQEFGELSGLKLKYIRYILAKPTRIDTKFTYTDIYSQGPPQTIKQLVDKYDFPNPPTASSSEAEKLAWQNTWGRYWPKIPLAANDKAEGELAAEAYGLGPWGELGPICPAPTLKIIVPEYFRTNLVSAHLNQLLLPKTLQSPLSYNPSQKENLALAAEKTGSVCELPPQNPPSFSLKDLPVTLLASAQTNFSSKSKKTFEASGEVLGEIIDVDHYHCRTPVADFGTGDEYCLPEQITIGPRTDTLYVCAKEIKICPEVPSGPCTLGDYWTRCVEGCDYGGVEEVFQCNGSSYEYAYPQQNPACCDYECPKIYRPDTKTIDLPIAVWMAVPYLDSIWNKSTSYLDNRQSGFLGFFAPSVETGVLLNQAQYEKHGETPDPDNYQGRAGVTQMKGGRGSASFVPPGQGRAYPDFIAGVKNATNWVREALWPF